MTSRQTFVLTVALALRRSRSRWEGKGKFYHGVNCEKDNRSEDENA
jgi:hypothetical protein